MTTEVFAVVLTHDQPELLARVTAALSNQTIKPSRVLIVDTSKSSDAQASNFESIKLPSKTGFADAIEAAVSKAGNEDFIWILHDDSIPVADTLEKLLREVELSPSLGVVGPKQLDLENPKIIKQLGLTLTKSWRLLSRVKDEFDQGQHDRSQDALAVGTAGALIRLSVYKELSGFNSKAPVFAQDVDFSLRARLAGHRVAVAPEARISHGMYSLAGKRPLSWLGGPVSVALRRAELHLMLSFLNPIAFLALWLFLIPLSVLNSVLLLFLKRGRAIPSELAASAITFFSLTDLLGSRSKIKKTTNQNFKSLASLLATRQEVKAANRRSRDLMASEQLIRAHAMGVEASVKTSNVSTWWWAIGIAALNVLWLPTNVAVTGRGLLPLGDSWPEIFANAGSQNIPSGLSVITQSDPWHWVLAIFSAPFFFAPSLAIALMLFLSTAIAFLGAHQLAQLVTSKPFAKIVTGIGYALWPALTISIQETRISQVIALTLLPWLLASLAKLLQLGSNQKLLIGSPWRQVGISALLFATVSASSPILGVAVLIGMLGFGMARPKQLLKVLFVPGLALAWWLPLLATNLEPKELAKLLLDPGVLLPNELSGNFVFFGYQFDSLDSSLLVAIPVVILAMIGLVAFLAKNLATSVSLWLVALLALGSTYVATGISFDFGSGPIGILPFATLGLFGLALWLLAAHLMEQNQRASVPLAWALVFFAILPSITHFVISPPSVKYTDGRIVPSIIQAEAKAGSMLNTLVLAKPDSAVVAEVFSGDGTKLHELTTSYYFSLSEQVSQNPKYEKLGQLVANLVSANGSLLSEDLGQLNIGYILVNPKNRDLQLALDSTNELESIGETDFGQLWKVREATFLQQQRGFDFGFIKGSQLALLGFYILLALPTGSARRRRSGTSEIFADVEENN